MRFANPHPPRHGAFLLIALFSCLQIFFGFFLFTGNESESVSHAHASFQIASHEQATLFNAIEPASGHDTTQKLSLSRDCEGCGTFSYFNKFRNKAKEKDAAKRHAAAKKHMQQKHRQHLNTQLFSDKTHHTSIKTPITDYTSNSTSSHNYK